MTSTSNTRRYGAFASATIENAQSVPGAIEKLAAEMREALHKRPDLSELPVVEGTIRILARNGGQYQIDWLLELPAS